MRAFHVDAFREGRIFCFTPRGFARAWAVTLALAAAAQSSGIDISTFAGAGGTTQGHVDAVGRAARFNYPGGMVADASGNLYVADGLNNAIRKILPDGTTTTFAGGRQGSTNGIGTNAAFNFPAGLAIDGGGNLYVSDRFNHTIRKITPAGVVTNFAGVVSTSGAFADGPGNSARFNHPAGLAVDAATNVYVADSGNSVIRKITPAGVVSTIAGQANAVGGYVGSADGPGAQALFNLPMGLTLDADGNLYVADAGNHTIREIAPDLTVSTLAGQPEMPGSLDGDTGYALFTSPTAITVDASGNIYVADTGNNTVRMIEGGSYVTTIAGAAELPGVTDGPGPLARFAQPGGIAVNPAGGLWVADTGNNTIRVMNSTYGVSTLAGAGTGPGAGDGPATSASFNYPSGVAVDGAGNVYVADYLNFAIRKIDPSGIVSTAAGQPETSGYVDGGRTNALFAGPIAVAVDGTGNLYVADADNDVIRVVLPDGTVSTMAGQARQPGNSDGFTNYARFNDPSGVAVDATGNVYVADSGNQTIRMITPGGEVSTLAGSAGNAGNSDGQGTNALFSNPSGIAVDSFGNVFVADSGNEAIRMVTPAGVVSTLTGVPSYPGQYFGFPASLALDVSGNLYVTDAQEEQVREISSGGVVSAAAGGFTLSGSSDGTGTNSLFNLPSGIALDGLGRFYVADALNGTVRVGIQPVPPPTLQAALLSAGIVLSWPASASNYALQTAIALSPPVAWAIVSNAPAATGTLLSVTNSIDAPARFFRLIQNHTP